MKWSKLLLFIGMGIFIYIIYSVGIDSLINVFKNVKFFWVLILVLISFIVIILQTYKWDLILKKQNINLKFYSLFKIQMISLLYGAITPGRLGSLIKINYLKKKIDKNYGETSSSVILERIIDFLVLFLFALFGAFLLINYYANLFLELLIIILIIIFGGLFIFLKRERTRFFLKYFHKHFVPKKYREKVSELFHSFYDGIISPKYLVKPFIVSLAVWFLIFSQAYVAALALSVTHIPYYYFLGLFPLASAVGLIPITVSGMGTKEAALIGLFTAVGYVIPDKIVAISLLWLFSSLIVNLLSLYYIFKEHKNE